MYYLYLAIAILIALTFHEAAHAWVAYKLGDPTAKHLGRISLNPIRHLDPIGTILFIILGIGWGKPVPVNDQNFSHPRRDNALVAAAGPAANLIIAIICTLLLKIIPPVGIYTNIISLLLVTFHLNLLLIVLNLLPIPPLDGSKIFAILIPKRHYRTYEQFIRTNVVYILLFFLFDSQFGPSIYGFSLVSSYLQLGSELLAALIFLGT